MNYYAPMNIESYLTQNNIPRGEFSKKIKIHWSHLNNILNGQRKPSAPLALRIEQATGGKVTLRELLFPNCKSRSADGHKENL